MINFRCEVSLGSIWIHPETRDLLDMSTAPNISTRRRNDSMKGEVPAHPPATEGKKEKKNLLDRSPEWDVGAGVDGTAWRRGIGHSNAFSSYFLEAD